MTKASNARLLDNTVSDFFDEHVTRQNEFAKKKIKKK